MLLTCVLLCRPAQPWSGSSWRGPAAGQGRSVQQCRGAVCSSAKHWELASSLFTDHCQPQRSILVPPVLLGVLGSCVCSFRCCHMCHWALLQPWLLHSQCLRLACSCSFKHRVAVGQGGPLHCCAAAAHVKMHVVCWCGVVAAAAQQSGQRHGARHSRDRLRAALVHSFTMTLLR